MAGINRDLEEHVVSKSAKYDFNFQHEKPIEGADADFDWHEVSDFSKSDVTATKPRMNFQPDRKSTADTTLHSIQPEVLSARGPGITYKSTFSPEAISTPNFAQRHSVVFPVTSQYNQICPSSASVQRFAAGNGTTSPNLMLYRRGTGHNDCIYEEHESTPSPNQTFLVDCRESLAECPGSEGPVQSPVILACSTPFT